MNEEITYDELVIEFNRAIDGEVSAEDGASWVWGEFSRMENELKEAMNHILEAEGSANRLKTGEING